MDEKELQNLVQKFYKEWKSVVKLSLQEDLVGLSLKKENGFPRQSAISQRLETMPCTKIQIITDSKIMTLPFSIKGTVSRDFLCWFFSFKSSSRSY